MAGTYFVEAADWLRSVGLTVVEVKGWQTRARSSGGFGVGLPWGCAWHHTASQTTPTNDTNWQYFTSDVRPIGNMTIMRSGEVWIGAAGAANTQGKGGPLTLSRGTIPLDGGNTRAWAIEVANNGVGEPWPQAQIDAYFTASNELNRRFGNKPTDMFTHAAWTPGRKIDPAKASAVLGPWRPRSINSSGTWNLDDIRAECTKRAGGTPPPSGGGGTYTVAAGDSWWSISQKLGCTVNQLLAANPPATSTTVIHPGDILNVPGSSSTPPPPTGDVVNWNPTTTTVTGVKDAPPVADTVANKNNDWALIAFLKAIQKMAGITVTGKYDQATANVVDSKL